MELHWYQIIACWIAGMIIGIPLGILMVEGFFRILEYFVFKEWKR